MDFSTGKAIYLQIADRVCDEILAGHFSPDSRIPSVRDYAMELGVNTNTAVRSYEHLAREGIVYPRRGTGYYVSPDARPRILEARREEFMRKTLPEVCRQMRMLGVKLEEVERAYKETEA